MYIDNFEPHKMFLNGVPSRRNYLPAFKAKVALGAAKGEYTLAELTQLRYIPTRLANGNPSYSSVSRRLLPRGGSPSAPPIDIKALHAKIGQLTLESLDCRRLVRKSNYFSCFSYGTAVVSFGLRATLK